MVRVVGLLLAVFLLRVSEAGRMHETSQLDRRERGGLIEDLQQLADAVVALDSSPPERYTIPCVPLAQLPTDSDGQVMEPQCLTLFFHGFSACADTWKHTSELVRDQGDCMVLAPSLPGHGFREGGGLNNFIGANQKQEAEKYLQFVLRLAELLNNAGLDRITGKKTIIGLSFGAPIMATLAVLSEVQWDGLLFSAPAFESPTDIVFAFPMGTTIDWSAPLAVKKLNILKWVGLQGDDCHYKNGTQAPGYCAMRAASLWSVFSFGAFSMRMWEAISTVAQGGDAKEAVHGPIIEAEAGSWSYKRGQKWYKWGQEYEFVNPHAFISSANLAGLRHLVEGKTTINVVTVDGDSAVGPTGVTVLLESANANAAQAEVAKLIVLPKTMPHAWAVLGAKPMHYWWLGSCQDSLMRFAILAESWPLANDGSPSNGFVDPFVDGSELSIAHVPYQTTDSDKPYHTRFWDYSYVERGKQRKAWAHRQHADGGGPQRMLLIHHFLDTSGGVVYQMNRFKDKETKKVETAVQVLDYQSDGGEKFKIILERQRGPPQSLLPALRGRVEKLLATTQAESSCEEKDHCVTLTVALFTPKGKMAAGLENFARTLLADGEFASFVHKGMNKKDSNYRRYRYCAKSEALAQFSSSVCAAAL